MTTQTIIGNLNQLSANARVSKPMSNTYATKIRHVGRTQEQVYTELRENIVAAISNAQKLAYEQYMGMTKTLTAVEMRQKIEALDLSKKVQGIVANRFLHTDRPEDSTRTVWALYNIVNEVIGERSRSDMRVLTRNNNLAERLVVA